MLAVLHDELTVDEHVRNPIWIGGWIDERPTLSHRIGVEHRNIRPHTLFQHAAVLESKSGCGLASHLQFVVLGDDAGQFGELLGVGKRAGGVAEARQETDSTVRERLVEERLYRPSSCGPRSREREFGRFRGRSASRR